MAVFKIPQEPSPPPSLESDEESFVVLGHSLVDSSTDIYPEPSGLSVIDEAKMLIKSELEAIEQTQTPFEEKKDGSNHIQNVSEQSKISLGTSTVLPEFPQFDKDFEASSTISVTPFGADMSSAEVQTKINQIIEENVHLKDTVLQNNMSLKSQYERILAWQEDVQKVHQTHKEKLMEAKAFIKDLQAQKDYYKNELIKFQYKSEDQEKKIDLLNKQLKEKNNVTNEVLIKRSDDNMKEFQLDVATKKIKDLEEDLEHMTNENKRLINENVKSSIQDEQNLKTIKDLKTQIESILGGHRNYAQEEYTLKNQEQEAKISKLESELKKIIKERDCAFKKFEMFGEASSSVQTDFELRNQEKKQKISKLESELKKIIKERDCAVKTIEELEDISNSVQEEFKLSNQKQELKISVLESDLNKMIKERNSAFKTIEELKKEFATIIAARNEREDVFIMTTNSLKSQLSKATNQPEEMMNLRTQLAKTQTALTQMEYTRAQAYSQVSQLTQELLNVKSQMEELKSEQQAKESDTGTNDELFVLNTQLAIYKADFEEERNAREIIKGEKDRLEEDIQNIQRRNQQLQEEIELLRTEHDYVMYPRHHSSNERSSMRAAGPSAPSHELLKCPRCKFGFPNIQALEIHVHKCLDLDDRLP